MLKTDSREFVATKKKKEEEEEENADITKRSGC